MRISSKGHLFSFLVLLITGLFTKAVCSPLLSCHVHALVNVSTLAAQKVRYQGIKIKIKTTNLGQDDFQIIPSHRTVTTIVDVGEAYNLTADGDYIISLSSDFDYAAMGSVELSTGGHFRLASGPINAAIDGKKAEKSFLRYHGRKNS